ncbi:MAG: hypothetical protein FD161_1331 [Limisphaerales bacterium]|nr:MAG: hypothetical protein FD161_1331 [Limisphaerales bacterium]KAG0509641.1 MAG: hypothetical protein E1N63_1250 [Limisphaerales bacterium]TXT49753.1 MAG: hypothetical protein FD140_2779 [Limisphaerales bacterium]
MHQGIIQIDLVWGDTEDRGFEWDSHLRLSGLARENLGMFKPKHGIRGVLASVGFETHSYDRMLGFLGPSLPSQVVFLPFWFLSLSCGSLLLLQVMRRVHGEDTSVKPVTAKLPIRN